MILGGVLAQHVGEHRHHVIEPVLPRRGLDDGDGIHVVALVAVVFLADEARLLPAAVERSRLEINRRGTQHPRGAVADAPFRDVHEPFDLAAREFVDQPPLLHLQEELHQRPRRGVAAGARNEALAHVGEETALAQVPEIQTVARNRPLDGLLEDRAQLLLRRLPEEARRLFLGRGVVLPIVHHQDQVLHEHGRGGVGARGHHPVQVGPE